METVEIKKINENIEVDYNWSVAPSTEEVIKLKSLFEDNIEAMNAYKILKYTKNPVFLTGKAGTGKSTFIRLAESIYPFNTAVVAPTAIAAKNVRGGTIHSHFHLPPEFILPRDRKLRDYHPSNDEREWYSYVDLIIIDEVSMVSSSLLDCIDYRLKQICNTNEPFGGKKLLLVGDPFQLPPIIIDTDKNLLKTCYKTGHFFESEVFQEMNPIKIELQTSYRQTDLLFLSCLNHIRDYTNVEESLKFLNSKCLYDKPMAQWRTYQDIITLTYRKDIANEINLHKLFKLPGKEQIYLAQETGNFNWKNVLAEPRLVLLKGARIMLTKNHKDGLYVNGTLGYVEELAGDKIIVVTDEGNTFQIFPEKYVTTKTKYYKHKGVWKPEFIVLGSMTQYPLKLGWAITVHKSQGLTFDKVLLKNNVEPFSAGQTYVALSRCRSLEGLKLDQPLKKRHIKKDTEILKFYRTVKKEKRVSAIMEKINKDLLQSENENENDEEL